MPFIVPFFSAVLSKQSIHVVLMEKERRQNEDEAFSQIRWDYNSNISLSAFRLMVLGS